MASQGKFTDPKVTKAKKGKAVREKGKRRQGKEKMWHAAFTAQFHYVKQTSDGVGYAA